MTKFSKRFGFDLTNRETDDTPRHSIAFRIRGGRSLEATSAENKCNKEAIRKSLYHRQSISQPGKIGAYLASDSQLGRSLRGCVLPE